MPNALIRDRVDSIGGRQITERQVLDPRPPMIILLQ